MIETAPDVNFWLDATRGCDTFAAALAKNTIAMQVIVLASSQGERCGVRFHTGHHVLANIRWALAQDEVAVRGVTRFAWSDSDIDDFVALVRRAVMVSGGRDDVVTVSHDTALREFRFSGAPDAEDHQMMVLAANSRATVLATSDNRLLEVGEFQGVELWRSEEIIAEVSAVLRRARINARRS